MEEGQIYFGIQMNKFVSDGQQETKHCTVRPIHIQAVISSAKNKLKLLKASGRQINGQVKFQLSGPLEQAGGSYCYQF